MAKQTVGRLMFRVEGDMWNVYWSKGYTPDDKTLFLGSIRMSMAQRPKIKKKFMKMMQDAFAEICDDVVGARPTQWDTRPGPDNERGNA